MSDPQVIAHRGGAGVWPENTVLAFESAHRAGCVLETDVRHTSDGVAVCFHDATVERYTGEDVRVSDLDLRALRARCAGAGLPLVTVEELLGGLPTAQVVLDVKDPGGIDVLAGVIRRTGATGRVCATGCFDAGLTRLRRAVGPELATGLGWWAVAALATGARFRNQGGAQWAFLHARLATPRTVARARAHGLRVAVWTVDEPAAAQRFLALGADAVTTDRPDRLLPVLRPGRAVPSTLAAMA
ncbi:glycerophosphodiester phosphodiesterase [Jatrophihabitans sp. YIM 134969]